MSELRGEPVSGRWIIIATERAARPTDYKINHQIIKSSFCPFCEGNEGKTPPEIMAYRDTGTEANTRGWRVRVVPNKFPALQIEGEKNERVEGIYDMMNGIGAHEVIIESPRHIQSITALDNGNVKEVLFCYRERLIDLTKDRRFVYGLLFKNVGFSAGASLEHTHSQLIVTPIVPHLAANEMESAKTFYTQKGRCLFCDMIQQETDTNSRIIIASDNFVVFAPFASRFPFETWILPKKHESHFEKLQNHEIDELAIVLKSTLVRLETALDLPPYNYIFHSAPFNMNSSEYYHWHIEIIPRLTNIAGFEWGTGFYINHTPPEQAAEILRNTASNHE